MICPISTNRMLTEMGLANVFRVNYRDDAAGTIAGQLPGRSLGR